MSQEQRPEQRPADRPKPPVEIYVYATNKNFLNIYDALRINKVKIELASYDQESGRQTGIASAWLDSDDLKLLVHLVTNRLFREVICAPTQVAGRFERFGGSSKQDGTIESRTLMIEYDDQGGKFARYPYRLTIANGPGKATQNGAIQPAGEPTSRVQMRIPESDLMKAMLVTRDYVAAYDLINYNRIVAEKTRELRERLEARDQERGERQPAPQPAPRPANPTAPQLASEQRSARQPEAAPTPEQPASPEPAAPSKVTNIRATRPGSPPISNAAANSRRAANQ